MSEEKRFTLTEDVDYWFVDDNTIQTNEFGYREDLTGEDAYRGFRQTLTEKEVVEIMNDLNDENKRLKHIINELKMELETHKHPLWSTREAERKINELTILLTNETKKNAILLDEINALQIENNRLKKR